MAANLDMSNGQANIAYVGETPWHKSGQALEPGQPIEVWAKAAGLAHEVHRAAVEYMVPGHGMQMDADRSVLYRSDTRKPLSIVSTKYRIVQPAEVLAFFDELCRNDGFTLETAGSLDGGRRVWALAKVNDGAPVIGHDVVKPYVLLATSYDGSMATLGKLVSIRVVCQNTLNYANSAAGSAFRVDHTKDFDAKACRLDMGIALDSFDKFLIESRLLAKKQMSDTKARDFLRNLLPEGVKVAVQPDGERVKQPIPVDETPGFKRVMALFNGEEPGADLPEARGSAWALLSAVTRWTDHERGRSANGRLSSAWFGAGEILKDRAHNLLAATVA